MDENDAVQDVKVVLIGDAAAGKSAIMKKFFDGVFDDDTATTIGIDFRHITYQLQDGTRIRLQVWDTAGQERFRKLAPSYIRDAHVILIVFDLTSANIVEQIARWTFFAEKEREDGALVVLVGSKCDLRQRRHNKFIMERMMAEYNAPYVETSAKTGFNIDEDCTHWHHNPIGDRQAVALKKFRSQKSEDVIIIKRETIKAFDYAWIAKFYEPR